MKRREFISLAAGAAAFAGCKAARSAGAGSGRLGVCSWSFQRPLDEVAARMKSMGLSRIHLAVQPFLEGDARHGAAENAAARDRAEARLASGEWRLSATMISFSHEDYSTLETIRRTGGIVPDATWPADLELVKRAAKLSAKWRSPYLSLHAGFLDESDKAALAKYVDRVKAMRDVCGAEGVKLILESGQETAEDLAKIMPLVEGVGINFDPANMILYGKGDPVKAVKLLAPWICHVHVKDAKKAAKPGIDWGEETPWGDGEVNPPAFFAALRSAGYRGAFAIEREGGNDRPGDIALAARRCRGMI